MEVFNKTMKKFIILLFLSVTVTLFPMQKEGVPSLLQLTFPVALEQVASEIGHNFSIPNNYQ